MTRLTFSGIRNHKRVTVTRVDGALSGDLEAVAWIRYVAACLEGQILGPISGPYTSSRHLADPFAAAELIRSIFPARWPRRAICRCAALHRARSCERAVRSCL